jgi:pyridoxine 4-dehydrogenase
MSSISESGTFKIGNRVVKRLGYGAMQLAGPGVFGPPKDHDAALAVLREAVAGGVNHRNPRVSGADKRQHLRTN